MVHISPVIYSLRYWVYSSVVINFFKFKISQLAILVKTGVKCTWLKCWELKLKVYMGEVMELYVYIIFVLTMMKL